MDILLGPLNFVLDVNNRLYFEYLASSLLLAIFVLFVLERKNSIRHIFHTIFPSSIWLTRSTVVDLALLCTNAWLKVLVWVPLFASAFSVAFYTVKFANWLSLEGVGGFGEFSATSVAILYTLVLVLCLDFSRFALHRFMHTNAFLWRFHKVHHSAETMTPLTLYRVHPVESMLQYIRDVLVTGVVTGIFFVLFGAGIDVITVAGVNVIRLIFNHAGANLRHSHIWLSFGCLEKIIISPAQHQIHHSSDPSHRDKNFGSQFAIWDGIFGSLYLTKARESLRFGVSTERSH